MFDKFIPFLFGAALEKEQLTELKLDVPEDGLIVTKSKELEELVLLNSQSCDCILPFVTLITCPVDVLYVFLSVTTKVLLSVGEETIIGIFEAVPHTESVIYTDDVPEPFMGFILILNPLKI